MAEIDAVLVAGVGLLVVTVFYAYRLVMKAKLHYVHERDGTHAETATLGHRIHRDLEAIRTEISKLTSTQSSALSESQTHTQLLGQIGGLGVSRELREISNEIRALENRLRGLRLKSRPRSLKKKFSRFKKRRKKVKRKRRKKAKKAKRKSR